MVKTFFERILDLPELKLLLDYWYVWIPLLIVLLIMSKYNKRN